MTRKLLTLLFFAFALSATAQVKWLKKARKSQLNLVTYDVSGQLLHSTNGFLIGEGVVLSDYTSFRGAARAVAIDEKGTEYPVQTVAGASSLYDVVKLRVDIPKAAPLPLAAAQSRKGEQVYVAPYLSNKSGVATPVVVEEVQTFNGDYAYYTLPANLNEKSTSCPVMNEAGEVIGLLQMAAKADEGKVYAISADYANSLAITALSANASDYRDILIRKELPAEASQASSFIFLTGTRDTALYLAYTADFIQRFPAESTGYTMQAEMQTSAGRYADAEATWEAGLKAKAPEAELRYSEARSILAAVQASKNVPESWTLEHALELNQQARDLDPQPVYTALGAHILYALRRYEDACQQFLSLRETNLRSAEHFLYAAQCQQILADTAAVLALQDSAVACFTKPYMPDATPALLMRATTLRSLGRHRDAVKDLNEYEHLMSRSLNANFYYQRYQSEMQCRMFQQALSDIERATRMEPTEPLYFAELAAVNYRFGQYDEAEAAARKAIALDADFADAHRILGVCLRAQKREAEAKAALQRAADLGDELAKQLLTSNP